MLLERWKQLSSNPIGKLFFNKLFHLFVPYTGSIHPEVIELRPGFCKILMKDRKKLRNHLNSIHAAALMNLAEATSGLAFVCGLPKEVRAIVTEFRIQYFKKARGPLTAECSCSVPHTLEESTHNIETQIKDEVGDLVATGRATWLVRPVVR